MLKNLTILLFHNANLFFHFYATMNTELRIPQHKQTNWDAGMGVKETNNFPEGEIPSTNFQEGFGPH